ncbi:MAG: Flp family type IVb pilin [Dehalococcoidia bacterium]
MKTTRTLYWRFRNRLTQESGQGLAEYALILGLVAAVCVGALSGLGGAIAGSSGFTVLPGSL